MSEGIFEALRRHAEASPERPALLGDGASISYAALLQRVEALADWLRARSLRMLGLCGENSVEWVIADLAAWRAGLTLVPIPGFFSPAQIEHVFASTRLTHLLVCGAQLQIASGTESAASPEPGVRLDRVVPPPGAVPALPRGTCKITFTSGTTGQPKGVCLLPSNLMAVTHALAARLHADVVPADSLSRHFTLLPLPTLLENVAGVYVPLLLGRSVMVRSGSDIGLLGSSQLDLPRLLQALQRAQPSSLIVLPQILRGLVAAAEAGLVPPDSLRFVAVGGAPTPPALIERARTLGIPVFEGYGLSECASVVALNAPGADRVGSVGRVLEHVRVRIDGGRIQVAGNSFAGYLADAAPATDEWLDTGDLGHFDGDGFLFVSGRAKNLIITSFGRNLSPEWPESALSLCPSIRQVMVFGDAQPFCGAIVVPTPGTLAESLRAQIAAVNADLPDYARVQRFIVATEAFTQANGCLTDNGRLRRDVIAARHATAISALYANPPTATETDLSHELF